MNKIKQLALASATAAAFLVAGGAQADLLEYSFTSAQGEQRTLKPSATYANPKGNIRFALSAGVDRMVRVSIVNAAGNVLSSQTSKLLGANDRITVGGREYYGDFLSLAAPAEGTYTLRAEIIGADGKTIVQSDEYPFVVDVRGPVISGAISRDGAWPANVLGTPHWGGSTDIYLKGINDAGSGLDKAFYVATDKAGNTKLVGAQIDVTAGSVIANVADAIKAMPVDKAEYQAGFRIYDRAGNFSEKLSSTKLDNAVPGLWPEILNSKTQVWEKYTSGMTVYANPVKFRYTGYRKDHSALNSTGYGWAQAVSGSTGDFIHWNYEAAFPVTASTEYATFLTTSGTYRTGAYSQLNLTLAPGVQKAPVILSRLDYKLSGKSWVTSNWVIETSPFTVEQVRFYVEPRDFIQRVTLSRSAGSCTVPVGASSCVIQPSNISRTTGRGYAFWTPYASKEDGTLTVSGGHFYTRWDFNKPVIDSIQRNEKAGTVTVLMNDPDTPSEKGGWYDWDTRSFKLDLKSATESHPLTNFKLTRTSLNGREAEFSIRSVPDGLYSVTATAIDTFGNEGALVLKDKILIDNTAPAITINSPAKIASLDQILIEVSDNYDPDPQITGIQLKGGPATDDVQLAWRKVTDRNYALEYPIVFPSMAAGEAYTLTVTAQDAHGNTVTKTSSFMYEPRQISLADGMDGKLMIPAVTHDFKRIDGGHVIQTAPIELANGAVVSGTYDVLATLRSDAKVPLVVNGVRIEPGQTMSVMSQHDFSTSGGRVNLSLSPAVAGVEGSSGLLVMTTAPNSPVLVLDVNTWIGKANISAEKWEVRQVIDALNITASPVLGVACRITSDEKKAKTSDIIRDPVCLLEWDEMPDEAVPVESKSGELILTSLGGQAVALGEQPVSYSLYLYSGDGQKVWVGSGRESINVVSALGSVSYEPARDVNTVHRVIEEVEMRMRQRLGPNCRPTLDAGQAQASAAARSTGALSTTCLFEWIEVPDGLQQDSYSDTPYLFGSLREKDDYKLHWRVSIYSKAGSRITLASESYEIAAIDPPLPEISMDTRYRFSDDLYMVPMDGGHIGDALIQGELTPLDIGVMRDSEVLTNETFTPGRVGAKNRVFRRLVTEPMNMWDETQFKIDGAYTLLPEVSQSKTFRAVAVPNSSIAPQIDAGVTQALDSEPLPVKVRMINRLDLNGEYNADTMGLWSVRLGREDGPGNIVPMTDYTEATNGEVEFQIDLSGIDRSVRLVAEARLHSPIEGYERIEKSQRLFLAVLRGGAIDADVTSRRLSGPAPLITVLQLGVNDWIDRSVTGDVTWQVSADDGATWEEYLQTDRNKFRWSTSFEHGSYLVRAHVKNMHSGAESMTETVEVVAYHKASGVIVGDQTIFAGTTATYEAQVTDGSGEPMDDALVQWTLDKGETFIQDGATLEISSEEPVRHRMEAWVRDPTAPDDDPYAYTKLRATADFRKIKGPGVYLNGPRVIEVGETYEYTARLNPPYRGMNVEMSGEFVLPNGERVSGTSVTYTPTEEDLEVGHVRLGYEAWVEGYRDEGTLAGRDLRARVWKYVWPNWALSVQSNAKVAPVEVSARARMLSFRGRLESPEYEWEIEGPGIGNIEDRWADMRTLTIVEPGTYTFRVTVKDGRDHETVMEETLEVGEANPYEVNISYTTSNEHMRAPLDIRMRPQIGGGHPRDRAQEYVYSINGERIESVGYGAGTTLEAGTHELSLFVMTRMGEELIETITLEVAANEPPVCEIVTEDRSSTWRLNAVCEDTDGRMRGYEWTINGEPVTVRSNRLTIQKSAHDDVLPLVQLIGYDDAGGYSDPVLAD